ncbi:hypothetical protein AV521_18280 [Streptomyces sp. IMTB 2501]|uniref:hypothetical protein n=1 Tax=Streptomyces sp. IMTB 2501 TaxID=1776340 RepID=UPI00096CAC0F|nr:hypothetical protein [Streptomyces sp. IMTB 2501]OLZ69464.1 hypothetical protein AV521_18280 [Streptomyces sp. IMTB 2501]
MRQAACVAALRAPGRWAAGERRDESEGLLRDAVVDAAEGERDAEDHAVGHGLGLGLDLQHQIALVRREPGVQPHPALPDVLGGLLRRTGLLRRIRLLRGVGC